MRERPILFNAAMVRALLGGTKTQTRRVMKPQPDCLRDGRPFTIAGLPGRPIECPYGAQGDRLWVRETFSDVYGAGGDEQQRREEVMYRADGDTDPNVIGGAWTPSIHMPRWACRLVLEITGVRVERLQQITEADARAEGCAPSWLDADDNETVHAHTQPTYRQGFARLWRDINGPDSWGANPWVWVVEFRRVDPTP